MKKYLIWLSAVFALLAIGFFLVDTPQRLFYPMEYVYIIQGSNGSYSHHGKYAVDLCGKDSGPDDVFASGNGVVIDITALSVTIRYYNVIGNSGTVYDYCDVTYYHNTTETHKVGDRVRAGEVFMTEGKLGNATGNHVHVSIKGVKSNGEEIQLMPERMFVLNPKYNKYVKNKSDSFAIISEAANTNYDYAVVVMNDCTEKCLE